MSNNTSRLTADDLIDCLEQIKAAFINGESQAAMNAALLAICDNLNMSRLPDMTDEQRKRYKAAMEMPAFLVFNPEQVREDIKDAYAAKSEQASIEKQIADAQQDIQAEYEENVRVLADAESGKLYCDVQAREFLDHIRQGVFAMVALSMRGSPELKAMLNQLQDDHEKLAVGLAVKL